MPLHFYRCDCGHQVEEYRSVHEGGTARLPICPWCSALTDYPGERDVPMRWVIPVVAMDAKEPFQRFEVSRQVMTRDGLQEQTESIDSLTKLRKIERDSEQRYRDGEGEPLRFRAWTQDASNRDVGSFGSAGQIGDRVYGTGETPAMPGNIELKRHGTTKPDRPLGPGLRRATSPLK